jgi:hypothetical protein
VRFLLDTSARDRHMASIPASLLEQLDLATVSEEP